MKNNKILLIFVAIIVILAFTFVYYRNSHKISSDKILDVIQIKKITFTKLGSSKTLVKESDIKKVIDLVNLNNSKKVIESPGGVYGGIYNIKIIPKNSNINDQKILFYGDRIHLMVIQDNKVKIDKWYQLKTNVTYELSNIYDSIQ